MAAGGSAPELFTSMIGTFQESAVGFGTIVGSAVFNVLFVIAMCAFFSKELLTLTWWPLARDSTYYTFSLLMLAVFFGQITPDEIHLWEALVLFAMYGGYVVLMMYNEALYEYLGFAEDDTTKSGVEMATVHGKEVKLHRANLHKFRAGILGMVARGSLQDVTADHIVNQIKGDAHATFVRLASSHKPLTEGDAELEINPVAAVGVAAMGVGVAPSQEVEVEAAREIASAAAGNSSELTIGPEDLVVLFDEIGVVADEEKKKEFLNELDSNGNGEICWDEFKSWYNQSEERVRREMESAFNRISKVSIMEDPEHIDTTGLRAILQEIGVKGMSEEEFEESLTAAEAQMDMNDDGLISRDEFYKWYESSEFWTSKNQNIPDEGEEEEEEDDVNSLIYPADADLWVKVFWCVSFPLAFILGWTIPDMRRDGEAYCVSGWKQHSLCWFSFFMSIFWIGVASFGMVDWATIVGDTCGIPPQVMGLTFLAAGTSVPDLLSSVVVAQQGKGDMAVSSSIGSNIFDVLVGLPVPWLAYNLIKGKHVSVGAKSLKLSILILLGMLAAVILTIKFSNWSLTHELGYIMLVLYFLFVMQDLLRDEELICTGGCF